jgi:cellulose synthase operon protein YhjQ
MDQMEPEKIDEDAQSENPEDVAVLYSWAKLQGAKYRDFSASRRAYRAQMRHRAAEVQRESERRGQLEAEAAAAAAEKAAGEAQDVARFHDTAARQAMLSAKTGESAVEEAASARAKRTAAELARRASMERVEAARRAEAVAAAEAAARREEIEMAEAHASAHRQARQYHESDVRRRAVGGMLPRSVGGEISDPYTDGTIQTRPDRIYHQLATEPEEDMQPMRYRNSRDSGRYIVPQPDPVRPVNLNAPLEYLATASLAREAEIAASGSAAAVGTAEKQAAKDAQFYPPRALETRGLEPRGQVREAKSIEREPVFSEQAPMSQDSEEMAPEWKHYPSGSEAMRAAYAERVAAAPLAARRHSPGRPAEAPGEPRVMYGDSPRPVPRAEFPPEPRTDVPVEPGYEPRRAYVDDDGKIMPDRRRRPRPDFSNVPLREYLPQLTVAADAQQGEAEQAVPAWIHGDTPRPEAKSEAMPEVRRPALPMSPVEDTLQHTRERVASRWFALKGVFDQGAPDAQHEVQRAKEMRAPLVTVFSLAGGVGKTSLIATLGRALSSTGERVLLTDTTSHGLLPFYFGASELRPGAVRTFSPPTGSADAPIYLVSYDVHERSGDVASQDWLGDELTTNSRGMQRVLVDLTPGVPWVARRLARMNSTMLVPVAPDMNSVISLPGVEKFFAGMADGDGRPVQPYYVLNQFDASLPLHLDVREVMRQQLGDRLLPFAIRRSPSVSEALAEGMTVMDYAPGAAVAGDYLNLVSWLRTQVAPATTDFRNARWSER